MGEATPGNPVELVAIAAGFGVVIGSFLNVVIQRLPRHESIVSPASRCPACGTPVRPWDNVPLLSYAWLRGRCRACGVRISPRYPAVELGVGLLFAAVALRYGATPMTPVWMAFAAALVAVAAIDLEHHIIPDEISLGGLGFGLVVVPALAALGGEALRDALARSLGGALLGGGMLWVVGFAHARLSTALGRTYDHWPGESEDLPRPSSLDYWVWFPGMGFGDVKLMAMIGAFFGPVGVVETLLVAAVIGLGHGLVSALASQSLSRPFGFGPALAAGAILVLLLPTGLVLIG